MNVSNEIDLMLDESAKEHLKQLFGTYFMGVEDTKLETLLTSLDQFENDMKAAAKALNEK